MELRVVVVGLRVVGVVVIELVVFPCRVFMFVLKIEEDVEVTESEYFIIRLG